MPDKLAVAKQAALDAGALIRSESRKQHTAERKKGFDFVTEVDRMSEHLIKTQIAKAFPSHGFFCEEQVSSLDRDEDELLREMAPYTWVVDALDGTTNFIRGIPQYAVSIALMHEGEAEVGVVYDPNRDELFAAQKGRGATLNGTPIHVAEVTELEEAIVSYGFPAADMEKRAHALRMADRIAMKVGSARIYNCAALLLCYVACGRTDLSWEEGLHLWDMAAGLLLVQEAGGSVARMDGRPMDRFSRENLAANPVLMQRFLGATWEGR